VRLLLVPVGYMPVRDPAYINGDCQQPKKIAASHSARRPTVKANGIVIAIFP